MHLQQCKNRILAKYLRREILEIMTFKIIAINYCANGVE